MEVKIWVLIGALGVTTAIIGFLGKMIANSIINKVDELVGKIDKLIQDTTTLQMKVNHLQERDKLMERRLNAHAERIRELELLNAKK